VQKVIVERYSTVISIKWLILKHLRHHIRFWYLRCCGCPGLRGRQNV